MRHLSPISTAPTRSAASTAVSISRLSVALASPVNAQPATIASGTFQIMRASRSPSPKVTKYATIRNADSPRDGATRASSTTANSVLRQKRYTFNLKDELLPVDPDTGREQSSISYEVDFELPPQSEPDHARDRDVFVPWSAFNATYRGKPKKDAKPIDLKKIKRISIMMRRCVRYCLFRGNCAHDPI